MIIRCGLSETQTDDFNICQNHLTQITRDLLKNLNCMWPDYPFVKRQITTTNATEITPETSEIIWKKKQFLLPAQAFVCISCYNNKVVELIRGEENPKENQGDSDEEPMFYDADDGSHEISSVQADAMQRPSAPRLADVLDMDWDPSPVSNSQAPLPTSDQQGALASTDGDSQSNSGGTASDQDRSSSSQTLNNDPTQLVQVLNMGWNTPPTIGEHLQINRDQQSNSGGTLTQRSHSRSFDSNNVSSSHQNSSSADSSNHRNDPDFSASDSQSSEGV